MSNCEVHKSTLNDFYFSNYINNLFDDNNCNIAIYTDDTTKSDQASNL